MPMTMVTTGSLNLVQKNSLNTPGSKELTEHPCSINYDDAPPLVTIMARCHDPPITQKPLCWKNTIFTRICGVHDSPDSNQQDKKQGHF
jgi:hypothetical protein